MAAVKTANESQQLMQNNGEARQSDTLVAAHNTPRS